MDVREKLVEILQDEKNPVWRWFPNNASMMQLADYLVSNGVTMQEWISVKDGLPKNGKEGVLIALRWGEVDIGWCEDGRWSSEFINEYEEGEVTHWMPIPQPPKGEKSSD